MSHFFDLTGQVALITGGGRGIGATIARRLTGAGALVGVFDREEGAAGEVAEQLKGVAVLGDVRDEGDVTNAVTAVAEALGPVSILVNNAGITGRAARTWELRADEVREVMDVNFLGPFLFTKAVLPGMV